MSLHDPKSKVAQVTSNDQKSKGSLCLNHLDNMAPVDMVVVSHYLQGFIHVRWLALGFLFTIDLDNMTGPQKNTLASFSSSSLILGSDPIRVEGTVGNSPETRVFHQVFSEFCWAF